MKRGTRSKRAHKRLCYIKKEPTRLVNIFTEYTKDQLIHIRLDPAWHKGQPSPLILNRTGRVLQRLSQFIYMVLVLKKKYIIHTAHIRHVN